MEKLYLWPAMPQLSILVLIIGLMIFMYFAREPMQAVLKTLAQAISGGLHLVARWSRETAEHLRRHSRELVIEAGRENQERKLDHELRRLESHFGKNLTDYPKLHRRLDDRITQIDADYSAAAEVPPEVPGWSGLVESVAAVKGMGEATTNRMLEDIRKAAVAGEKKALGEYRASTAKRHKILSAMAPHWKDLKGTLDRVGSVVSSLLDTTRRIDAYIERYEKIRGSEQQTANALSSTAVKLFVVSVFVIAIAVAAAFINFQLIALPMSELVPSGTRLIGMPVATVAALVIVLMEIAAGIFLLDTLGITSLFPQLATLPDSRRRLILGVAFAGLLLLASIEASLAVLREQLVEAEMTLMESLAGSGAVGEATASRIPVVGQAVLGFTLPWILAMIAIPLEMLIDSGRHVVARFMVLVLLTVGVVTRLLAYLTQYLILVIAHLYDAFIMIPIQIERWVRGDKAPKRSPLTAADLTHQAALVAMAEGPCPVAPPPLPTGHDNGPPPGPDEEASATPPLPPSDDEIAAIKKRAAGRKSSRKRGSGVSTDEERNGTGEAEGGDSR